ncbi:MAG: DUF6465 family protein [Peptoniphilaceae bacterium]|nr:DUF6465 family protein [Peptoniphilaceae bacterium]MDY4196041.1 DUF6465 family protein [Peptoniphilaceae bacterium]
MVKTFRKRRKGGLMKTNLYIQFQGKEVEEVALVEQVKKYWKEAGKKIKDIHSIDLYVKPEESCAYYRVNGEAQTGRVEF